MKHIVISVTCHKIAVTVRYETMKYFNKIIKSNLTEAKLAHHWTEFWSCFLFLSIQTPPGARISSGCSMRTTSCNSIASAIICIDAFLFFIQFFLKNHWYYHECKFESNFAISNGFLSIDTFEPIRQMLYSEVILQSLFCYNTIKHTLRYWY